MNSKINIKEIWTSRFKRNDMNNDGDFSDFSDKAKTEMKKLDDIVKAINNVECDNCENNGIGGKTQLSYVKHIHMGENKSIDNLDK